MKYFEKIISDIAPPKNEFCSNVEVWVLQKYVNLVDLDKSFLPSINFSLAKIGVDTAEDVPLEVRR